MNKKVILILVVLAAALSLLTLVASADPGVRHFTADLDALNNSGVSGTAHLTLDGDQLTVTIMASGLEDGAMHPQHIHGRDVPSNATCPTPDADADGDGLVSVGEGLPSYGGVKRPLPTQFDGDFTYTVTYSGGELDGLRPLDTLQNRAIVLHGMTANGQYIPSLPVACGQIWPAAVGLQ